MKLTITVEVDPQQWADEYEMPTAEVRADVESYLRNSLPSAPMRVVAIR